MPWPVRISGRKDPDGFAVGDTVRVQVKVVAGAKERTHTFEGVVVRKRGDGLRATFTVRRISYGVGVERTFPVHSVRIERVDVIHRGRVDLSASAREKAQGARRPATPQIEREEKLGGEIENMFLSLQREGKEHLSLSVERTELYAVLQSLVDDPGRAAVKTKIASRGTPLYTTDPRYPGRIVAVQADGTRVPGHLEGRRFVSDDRPAPAVRPPKKRRARNGP